MSKDFLVLPWFGQAADKMNGMEYFLLKTGVRNAE
jgi:hypothetical protein